MEELLNSLPPDRSETGRPRRARWQYLSLILGGLVAVVVVGGLLVRVPYVALVPGTARNTESLISVSGLDTYPTEGQLLFTTVRVRDRPNLWEYLWLRQDDNAEVVPEQVILGDRSEDENRKFNLQQMNDSKSVAIAVALEELGYDAIDSNGVVITDVVADAPAAGVLVPGDTLVAIDGHPITATQDLLDALKADKPGQQVALTVEPFQPAVGQPAREDRTVVLGAKPDDPAAAFLGVGPHDRINLKHDFNFTVNIDSGSVGGPSAGLAFTLAVLDQLTQGELTGGAKVAVTGTIDAAGNVGPIGGVAQKVVAVRKTGADLFIVPASLPAAELDQARARAGDHLKIIPVNNLDEALAALATLGGQVSAVPEYAAGHPS